MLSHQLFLPFLALILGASGVVSAQTAPWSIVESPNPSTSANYLKGTDALASDDAWAVGYRFDTTLSQIQNLAMHWNGSVWTVTPTPNLASPYTNQLKKVTAISPGDVWAVGGHGLSFTLHWDGTQWSRIPLPPIHNQGSDSVTNYLEDIDAVSPDDIWMVGAMDALNGGTWTLTMHWDGTNWTQVPSPNQPTPTGSFYSQGLDAVVAIAANDVWAVGYYRVGSTPHPLVLHWNGTQWSIVPAPDASTGDGWLHGIAAAGPNDIWAVGEYDKRDWATFAKGLAMHWDGNTWTVSIPPQPSPFGVNPLSSVVARGPNDFYAAGDWETSTQGLDTFIVHWNGAAWTQAPSENPAGSGTGWNQLNDMARDPQGGLWTVGSGQASFGSPTFTLIERANVSGLPSPTPTPSASPTATPAITPTPTPSASPTATPAITPTPAPSASPTATPAITPTPAPSVNPSATPILTPSPSPTPNPTSTPTPFASPTSTPSASPGPSATPTPSPSPSPSHPLNISTRGRVEPGDSAMIAGFIITGDAPKRIYLRALGPSLASAGVNEFLADPVLHLFAPNGSQLATNDNWRDSQAAEIMQTGIPPAHNLEAAIVTTLAPGAYTAVMEKTNGSTGIALIEAYDLDSSASSELANISTRALVQTQENVMIAGFILGGSTEPSRVAIRALGPALTAAGIENALPDPTLELRDQNGEILVANDNWQDDPVQAAQILSLGLAPSDERESAIVVTLAPEAFTAIVAGQGGSTGVGLIEVYHVP